MKNTPAWAVGMALALSNPAWAATDDDLRELREQFRALKEQYERRIDALEKRLEDAERQTARGVPGARPEESRAAAAPLAAPIAEPSEASRDVVKQSAAPPTRAADNAFNPGISLILNGTYGNLSRDPNNYRINGFVPSMGEVQPPLRGPSLGESELTLAANIDPDFRGVGIFALAPDDTVAVEEAYVQTLSLGHGLNVKAGRFLGAIGYLNEIHAHQWDFTDAPLVSKAFLGGQLNDDGVQIRWIAPTELYADVGVDLGRGRAFPAGPAGGRNRNGFGAATVFTHIGGDIGESVAWQAGVSHLRTSPQDRLYDDTDSAAAAVTNAFSGRSRLWALGGVLKWAPNGNASMRNLKLQAEYFRRSEQGTLTYDTKAASLGTQAGGFGSKQSGWYAQAVYQFMPRWRLGYRHDRLDAGTTTLGLVQSGALAAADFPVLGAYDPTRNTVMTDWSPSEFSRVRVQLARDRSRLGAPDNQLFVQYIMSLGAHGAHRF